MLLTVTLLQTNTIWGDPHANMARAEALIAQTSGSDLYVLPEMWATGFATTPMEVPTDDGPVSWMQSMAQRCGAAICGSLAVRLADGSYRNRHYMALPDGTLHHYDKHHLFTYGHEDEYFTPGNSNTIVNYRGVSILLLTCYDLRFPLWARYGRAGHYDLIVCVANWPESRQQAWRILTRARAIENQCFLVGVNRVGDDAFCHYRGESLVCDSRGETLAECAPNQEQAITVGLDLDRQQHARQRFRVLDDRD